MYLISREVNRRVVRFSKTSNGLCHSLSEYMIGLESIDVPESAVLVREVVFKRLLTGARPIPGDWDGFSPMDIACKSSPVVPFAS